MTSVIHQKLIEGTSIEAAATAGLPQTEPSSEWMREMRPEGIMSTLGKVINGGCAIALFDDQRVYPLVIFHKAIENRPSMVDLPIPNDFL